MKKRNKTILSVITCLVSTCLLMFGVYAASSPSVSVGGQVSYTARDAKVLVQGKVNGAKDSTTGAQMATVDYPSATIIADSVTADKVTNSQMQYLDYTEGTETNKASDNLSTWNIGTLDFFEDNTGVKDITIKFKLTNLSTYPVQATLSFPSGATERDLASANVSRTASATSAYLAQNGGSKEITVTYKLTNDSQNIPDDATNLLGMNIAFAKTALKDPANSISEINKNNGLVTMGKSTGDAVEEDVQWKCFAYSTDGTTWTKLDSGASIPATAKYGYFVLDTYVSSLDNKVFLAQSKYTQNSSDNKYYINAGENGVAAANTVFANDYYYSDIRQTLKGLETTLSISSDNEIYSAIQGRTMADLYKLNFATWNSADDKYDTNDQSAPTGADMAEVDTFWLMSTDEAQTYFADNAARKWMNRGSGEYYWLRSPRSDASCSPFRVYRDGDYSGGDVVNDHGARAAFKLQLA